MLYLSCDNVTLRSPDKAFKMRPKIAFKHAKYNSTVL